MFGQIKKKMKEETSSEQKGVHLIAPTVKRKKHSLIPVEGFVLFWVFFSEFFSFFWFWFLCSG